MPNNPPKPRPHQPTKPPAGGLKHYIGTYHKEEWTGVAGSYRLNNDASDRKCLSGEFIVSMQGCKVGEGVPFATTAAQQKWLIEHGRFGVYASVPNPVQKIEFKKFSP
jgi:hypothetical protein